MVLKLLQVYQGHLIFLYNLDDQNLIINPTLTKQFKGERMRQRHPLMYYGLNLQMRVVAAVEVVREVDLSLIQHYFGPKTIVKLDSIGFHYIH